MNQNINSLQNILNTLQNYFLSIHPYNMPQISYLSFNIGNSNSASSDNSNSASDNSNLPTSSNSNSNLPTSGNDNYNLFTFGNPYPYSNLSIPLSTHLSTPLSTPLSMPLSTHLSTSPSTHLIAFGNLYKSTNTNYTEIAQLFIEKYLIAIQSGLSFCDGYYEPDSKITLYVNNGISIVNKFEFIGYNSLKCKLIELGIQIIRTHSLTFNYQPVGKNRILVSIVGKIEINGINYNTINIISFKSNINRITNQILKIFK